MTCRLILPNYMKIPEFVWENTKLRKIKHENVFFELHIYAYDHVKLGQYI